MMKALSYIERVFPPPQFVTLPSAGVDISDSSLKYVHFVAEGKTRTLAHWGDISVPEGVVTRGNVHNHAGLVAVLAQVRLRCGTPYVRISLPEERAYLFETTIKSGTPAREIRGLLEFRMEENVPLSPRDAFFDYEIVEDDADAGVLRVGVSVYARETITSYYDACREAGLMPLSFEVESEAIARAVVPAHERVTSLLIDFGNTRTGIGIMYQGALLYTSTIDLGGQHLSRALKEQCGEHDESEYTRLKNEHGLLATGEDEVYEALLPTVAALKDEIATRVAYWNTRETDGEPRAIEKIILCGGSANLAGLPEYLTEELGIETERAYVWQNAALPPQTVPPITRRYSYGYATAIGLALRTSVNPSPA